MKTAPGKAAIMSRNGRGLIITKCEIKRWGSKCDFLQKAVELSTPVTSLKLQFSLYHVQKIHEKIIFLINRYEPIDENHIIWFPNT